MREVAQRYPERYEEISHKLVRLGLKAGESVGGSSFGEDDFNTPVVAKERSLAIRKRMRDILDSSQGSERRQRIRDLLDGESDSQVSAVLDEIRGKNAFSVQLEGAGRGNPGSLTSLLAGGVSVADSFGETIPIPITRGYAQGLTPLQYLALAHSSRKGITTTKLGVGMGGYLSKILQQAAHRVMVTDDDNLNPIGKKRGYFVETDDDSNVGALLADDYGQFKRNDVITPKIQTLLRKDGHDRILVRSPLAASNASGGVYAKDVGLRENGQFARVGDAVGQQASQAIGEMATQFLLAGKHRASQSTSKSNSPGLSGFELMEKLTNLSESTRGLSAHALVDGRVQAIREAPQGGQYVMIGNDEHYVAPEFDVTVKLGEEIEAGMPISNGVPNPAIVTRLRGIGEGRDFLVKALRSGINNKVDRRQLELLATGLIDRVKFSDEYGEFLPDDIAPYSRVESLYQPRDDHEELPIAKTNDYYLEEPVLHYSIGTRMTPSVRANMHAAKVDRIKVHRQPPPFEPHVSRGLDLLSTDPDWMTRFLGSNLKKGFLQAVHTGGVSDENSTSFVPSRASVVNFGRLPLHRGQPMESIDNDDYDDIQEELEFDIDN